MRINVYSEEMGEPVELIQKDGVNGNETFYGLRVWLKSPKELLDHSTPEDDDRSAITFWARTKAELYDLVIKVNQAISPEMLAGDG